MDSPKIAPEQNSLLLSAVKQGHQAFVHRRRVRVLAQALAAQIPHNASVLDIGCGDGTIASFIVQLRPDISIKGVEVLPRADCRIACSAFDGNTLPFDDNSIGMALATRDLMSDLRSAGAVTRGPAPLSRQDISRFLSALDLAVTRLKRMLNL